LHEKQGVSTAAFAIAAREWLIVFFFAFFAALLCELRGKGFDFRSQYEPQSAKLAKTKDREAREEIQIAAQANCYGTFLLSHKLITLATT
jgi:hypothetical protein